MFVAGTLPRILHTALHIGLPGLLLLAAAPAPSHAQRAALVDARDFAYDANFRNSERDLECAIESMRDIRLAPADEAYRQYYLSWTHWALSAAQLQRGDSSAAVASALAAAAHARAGLRDRPEDPEFHTALVNALIVVATLDPQQLAAIRDELFAARRRALAAGPENPRVLMMDAGMLFYAPAASGGGQDRGLARWNETLRAFDREAESAADPLMPRWGRALAHGWLAGLLVNMSPPRHEDAAFRAREALTARPDFWYVKTIVVPHIREPE